MEQAVTDGYAREYGFRGPWSDRRVDWRWPRASAMLRSPNVESQANTALVTALLSEGPTCVRCIARECSLSLAATETVLTVVQRALEVQRQENGQCRECGHFAVVFSLHRYGPA